MASKAFKYLIPIYIVYMIGHMIFFMSFIFSQFTNTINDTVPQGLPQGIGFLFLSHFLVIILGIIFMVFMIIDCAKRKFKKDYEKVIWIVIMIFVGVIGQVVYYYIHGKKPEKEVCSMF